MAGFYKVVIKGTASGQEINNILYYAPLVPGTETFEEDVAAALGPAVTGAWKTHMLPLLSSNYALQGADVSMIDEDGGILSPFVVSTPDSGAGGSATAPETMGMCYIAKFNCTPVAEVAPHPVPRRSYLAIGPITADAAGASGLVTGLAGLSASFTAAFTQGHLISGTLFYPYRVGRTYPPSTANPEGTLAGVGRVHSIILRPYVSFRRSRLFSPTGN